MCNSPLRGNKRKIGPSLTTWMIMHALSLLLFSMTISKRQYDMHAFILPCFKSKRTRNMKPQNMMEAPNAKTSKSNKAREDGDPKSKNECNRPHEPTQKPNVDSPTCNFC
mgnify:CR=1 FL=1